MTINITVAGTAYPSPSSASDVDWAAQQVALLQALAGAINTATYSSLSLINSWAQWSSFQVPRSCLLPNGVVLVDGSATGGASASIAFVLPSGRRPAVVSVFPAVANGALGSDDTLGASLKVATNGEATIYFPVASDGNVSFSFIFKAA